MQGGAVFTKQNEVRRHTSNVPANGQSVLVRNVAHRGHEAKKSPGWGLGGIAPPLLLVSGPSR